MVWFIEAELQTLCVLNVVVSFCVREQGGNGTKRLRVFMEDLFFSTWSKLDFFG